MKKELLQASNTEHLTKTQVDLNYRKEKYFSNSMGTPMQKLESLSRYISRQDIAKFICYLDVFRATANVSGSIIECGVYFGNGLMTWAKMATAIEPFNYNCKVIGFDTFSGNTDLSDKDLLGVSKGIHKQKGGYYADSYADLQECISIFDNDRPLNQFPKVEMVKGDLCKTASKYIESHQNLVVRILSLSVNLYEPTIAALKAFLPRMPKGSIIVPFTLNTELYQGVTIAIHEVLGINGFEIRTPPLYPNFNYIVL